MSCKFKFTSCKFKSTSYEFKSTNYEFKSTNHEINESSQVNSLKNSAFPKIISPKMLGNS